MRSSRRRTASRFAMEALGFGDLCERSRHPTVLRPELSQCRDRVAETSGRRRRIGVTEHLIHATLQCLPLGDRVLNSPLQRASIRRLRCERKRFCGGFGRIIERPARQQCFRASDAV